MNIEEIRAHPRVCGENYTENAPVRSSAGSSPRVRGKLSWDDNYGRTLGLIPACAGKTNSTGNRNRIGRAHPRVCGENAEFLATHIAVAGSSPRVRGKRIQLLVGVITGRLIPACAGKTPRPSGEACSTRAHPRVCGENLKKSNRP